MRKWKIFIIQHSHVDIGYTERQELIGDYHRQFLEQAVSFALSPRQNGRGEDTKFRFTCEGFWAVEQFLARASEAQVADFLKAVKLGYIELTAFYAHFTELMDEETTRHMLDYAVNYAKSIDYHLDTAMACDINGFCWGMADMLHDAGVRYLMTNINDHHGGYPFDKPFVPFYWESPSGKKILVWNGIAYHKANLMGLVPGLNLDGNLGIPGLDIKGSGRFINIQDLSIAEHKVFPFLEGLEKQGYENDFIVLCGSGLWTDNSPPTDAICEHLNQWNAKHGDSVHIRTSTVKDFFKHLAAHSINLPTWKGDWNDWWSDGVASTPAETMIFRDAQRTKKIVRMLDPQYAVVPEKDVRQIENKLILFAEHTWGYAYSVRLPWELKSRQILSRKSEYAYSADSLAHTALDRILTKMGMGQFKIDQPLRYRVLNPQNENITAPVDLTVNYWEAACLNADLKVVDENGAIYPCQVQMCGRDYRVCFIADMKAVETREFSLDCSGKPKDESAKHELSEAPRGPDSKRSGRGNFAEPCEARNAISPCGLPQGLLAKKGRSYENTCFRMQWELGKGIYSLMDKTTGSELLGKDGPGLCTPVYQIFPASGDNQLDSIRSTAGRKKIKPQDSITAGELMEAALISSGTVYTTLEFKYKIPGASLFNVQATFYNELPILKISVCVNKKNVWTPEGLYVCFPFEIEGGVWHIDKAVKAIRPGLDQLPKTCCDYYLCREGAVLAGTNAGIAVSLPDAPLIQLGHLRLWEYNKEIKPAGALYSWLTNNKWETNFKASCGGFYGFSYTVETGKMLKDPRAGLRRCELNNYPLLSFRM